MAIFAVSMSVSYFFAFFLSMAFEIPVGILEMLIIDGLTTNRKKERRRTNDEALNGERRPAKEEQGLLASN